MGAQSGQSTVGCAVALEFASTPGALKDFDVTSACESGSGMLLSERIDGCADPSRWDERRRTAAGCDRAT